MVITTEQDIARSVRGAVQMLPDVTGAGGARSQR
jgi:hypothetical protein